MGNAHSNLISERLNKIKTQKVALEAKLDGAVKSGHGENVKKYIFHLQQTKLAFVRIATQAQ